MPKAVEECVKKIHGTNKRTGKPYTQSEKWAICNAAHKKSKSAEVSDEEINAAIEDVTEIMELITRRLINERKVTGVPEAYAMAEVLLARAGFDINNLEFSMKHLR